jgi:hypothetical protein
VIVCAVDVVVVVAGLAVVVVSALVVLVVLLLIGGLVGWLVDEGWTVPAVVSAAVVEPNGPVVLVGAEPEGEPHAAITSDATAT